MMQSNIETVIRHLNILRTSQDRAFERQENIRSKIAAMIGEERYADDELTSSSTNIQDLEELVSQRKDGDMDEHDQQTEEQHIMF